MQILYSQTAKSDLDTSSILEIIQSVILMAYFSQGGKLPNDQRNEAIKFIKKIEPTLERFNLSRQDFGIVFNEILAEGIVENTKENMKMFLSDIFSYQKELQTNPNTPALMLELFGMARRMANGSESATKNIAKKISIFKSPLLNALFSRSIKFDPQRDMLGKIEDLVKILGGKNNKTKYSLDIDIAKNVRKKGLTNSEISGQYTEYLRLRREANEQSKDFVQSFVRKNQDEDGQVDYQDLLKAIQKNKIKIHTLSKGFEGFIDDQMRLYTDYGLLIAGKPSGGKIIMNPNYDGEKDNAYVFKAIVPGALTKPTYYTEEYSIKSNKKKFVKVQDLENDIEKLRRDWRKYIVSNSDQHDTKFLSAMLLEIVYQTQARIGSVTNKTNVDGKYQKTFGLSTILCKHIKKINNGVSIIYNGKKNGRQKHKLTSDLSKSSKIITNYLLEWKDERKPNDPVFMTSKGKPIAASYVNNLLKKLGSGDGITVHKLRHLKGMHMMAEIVESNPWKKNKTAKSSSEVTKWLNKKALAIGKQLGHFSGDKITSTTAIKAYCPPSLMISIFRDASVPIPKTMSKIAGIDTLTGQNL